MHILDKIVAHKKKEVQQSKKSLGLKYLIDQLDHNIPPLSMKDSIMSHIHGGVISEFKKKSPNKKNINLKAEVPQVINGYNQADVAGISVLTDNTFFGGSHKDLENALKVSKVPVLRKEFIVDPYQIYQTKLQGAHTILLIARILTTQQLKDFTKLAHDLNLEVLVEIHNQAELDKCPSDMDIIGVNNRNLDTFEVNYQNSIRLKEQLPQELCKISESGISNTDIMVMLRQAGFDGFLIGEMFMKTENPGQSCQNFLAEYRTKVDNL